MTFPVSPLAIRMRIALGADLSADPSTYTWTDITTYVDTTFDITDSIGATDEASESNTSVTFTLRNNDARFTTDNPESPYWPYWDIGCPIEYSKDNGDGGGWRDTIVTYLGSAEVSWTGGTQHRCVVDVVAGGLFRRLGLDPALSSPIRRTTLDFRRKAYYPLEDATGATQAASALPTAPPLVPNNGGVAPEFGAAAMVPGTAAMARFTAGSRLAANLPSNTTATSFRVSFLLHAATAPAGQVALYELYCVDGSVYRYGLELGPSNLRFRAWSPTGVELSGAPLVGFTDQYTHAVWVDVDMSQSGTNVAWNVSTTRWSLNALGMPTSASGSASGAFAGTLGAVRSYALAPYRDVDDVLMAHWALSEAPLPPFGGMGAVLGWAGNTAAGRVVGMCNEAGVPASVVDANLGAVMGPQLIDSLLANLRNIQQTDHGVLSDHTGKVTYRSIDELYNLAPGLTLSRTRRGELGVISPVRDDTVKVNVASASRPGGSSYTVADSADVARYGRYEREPISVNVAVDTALPGHAGWALARGTDPGQRYQQLEIKLHVAGATTPGISTQVLALALGDRIAIESLPPQAAKGGAELQVRGRVQVVNGSRWWKTTYDLVPVRPYNAFVLDQDRLDTAGTEVAKAASSTDTVVMTATAGALIVTGAGLSVPLYAAGEKVTLTACANEQYTDPFTRSVTGGWGSAPATAHLPSFTWAVSGSGGTSAANFNVTGSAATISISAALEAGRATLASFPLTNPAMYVEGSYPVLATGGNLEIQMDYRRVAATNNAYSLRVAIVPGGTVRLQLYSPSAVLLADVATSITHIAGQVYKMLAAPIGDRHLGKVWIGSTEPPTWNIDLIDTERVIAGTVALRGGRGAGNTNAAATVTFDNFAIRNTQALTVTRSVNGVAKALPANSEVRLWDSRGLGIGA